MTEIIEYIIVYIININRSMTEINNMQITV